jgi:hypothetical protein
MLNDSNKQYPDNRQYPDIKQRIIKYLLIGILVCIAARYIPALPLQNKEIIMIGAVSSITFAIIDMLSPTIKFEDNSIKN